LNRIHYLERTNKVALVSLFKKEIHLILVWKLIKIGQLKNLDSLDNWYKKALSFKRSRREAIKESRGDRRVKVNLGKDRTTSVLDVLRQDPNTIEVDKCKEQRKCYNCRKKSYLAARYTRPKKGRIEIRIIEEVKEDFSQDRE